MANIQSFFIPLLMTKTWRLLEGEQTKYVGIENVFCSGF
jgi:hypothetical protein